MALAERTVYIEAVNDSTCEDVVLLAVGIGGFIRAPAPGIVHTTQTHEMAIPNDLIGCIIGRGGSKINEIR